MSGMPTNDPDFRYLGVDKKKALAEAPPYDGKKNCWIPHVKLGYVGAEIESTKGDMVTVKTDDNLVSGDDCGHWSLLVVVRVSWSLFGRDLYLIVIFIWS